MTGSADNAKNDIYEKLGFGRSLGILERLDLPIVDFVNGFADPVVFGGGNIPAARTKEVLAAARRSGWPVAHSRIIYADDGADANVFPWRCRAC